MDLKLRKVHDLDESNFKDTILLLARLKKKGYPINSDEVLNDIIDVLASVYEKEEMTTFSYDKSAYLLFNNITTN